MAIIDAEIVKLSRKRVISKCEHSPDLYLSPVFTRPKKDGMNRMILNLKGVNSEITYHHFKMNTLQVALKLVTQFCFMFSIDLKDAYYSVPIAKHHRKFLRFSWRGQLWQFDSMPNGLALTPRKFTELLKPVLAGKIKRGRPCHLLSWRLASSVRLWGRVFRMCKQQCSSFALVASLFIQINPF